MYLNLKNRKYKFNFNKCLKEINNKHKCKNCANLTKSNICFKCRLKKSDKFCIKCDLKVFDHCIECFLAPPHRPAY